MIAIDPAAADFHEPHIRQQFERSIKDFAILAILTETMKRDELLNQLGRIVPFNVLRAPLETVEIQYRLQAAFAFAESRAELFFSAVNELNGLTDWFASPKIVFLQGNSLARTAYCTGV